MKQKKMFGACAAGCLLKTGGPKRAQKKRPYIRPILMALLIAAMVAVPAVSAYSATDYATSYKEALGEDRIQIQYYAETRVTEVMDEIYSQANLWYKPDSGARSNHVVSTPMEHCYNVRNAGAYGVYKGADDSFQPDPGYYQTRGYRAVVKDGVVSKNWFDQNGWTPLP